MSPRTDTEVGDADAAEVVAIDGPAGAGKSTVARRLAEALGWAWLDTGAMYRAVTVAALRRGVAVDDREAVAALARDLDLVLEPDGRVHVGGRDVTSEIRTADVDAAVSIVAGFPEVRAVMVEHQRRFARRNRRLVAEGRDMGTVVFPGARVKIYLDAAPEVRAVRRQGQIRAASDLEQVRAGIESRDRLDSTRSAAPLRRAPDAWYLDTTPLTLAEVLDRVRSHVRSALRPDPGAGPSNPPSSPPSEEPHART